MKTPLFTGACTALITPFLNREVNYPMLEQLLRRQMDAGIEAVVICGTTGESPTLSDSEKLELFRCAKSYVGGQMKIIAGTGSNNTAHALSLSKAAESVGADGVLIVTPYYNKATPAGLYVHYKTIAEAVNIPIIGMGGIASAEDAIEMILVGASAIAVGTANFHNPNVTMEIVEGIERYMKKYGFQSVKEMVGIVK